MKEEGVSLLRSRFGFTRTTGTARFGGPPIYDSSPKTERRQKLFLKKLEYFNSNSSQQTNNINSNNDSKPRRFPRVVVNNTLNRAKENVNANEEKSVRIQSVTKTFSKVSPQLSPRKTDPVKGSQLKKPLFVTKYSPYRGDTRSQTTPLIMTAGFQPNYRLQESGQPSRKNDSKSRMPVVSSRPPSSTSSMQKPSQLPGLRASFLNSDNSRLTSASLHSKSYGYKDKSRGPSQEKVVVEKEKVVEKAKVRKFVSYKSSGSCEPEKKVDVTPTSRKWVVKKTEEKGLTELECLNKLRLSNKMMLEQQAPGRTRLVEPSLQTIPQDTELCEDCSGETEEDSGIFTSSHSKYSLDDEMIESDEPPVDSPRDSANKDIKNFSSDSDDMCSRETSPMQLLADLLRNTPDTKTDSKMDQTETDGRTVKHTQSSLVKRRKQQFELEFRTEELPRTNKLESSSKPAPRIDFQNISNIPDLIARSSQPSQEETEKSPSNESSDIKGDLTCSTTRMETSLLSNTSRLSVCTDCTASSEDNENKFFDDDYNDQQQLILNSEQEQSYDETLFDAVDSLLQENKEPVTTQEKAEDKESKEDDNERKTTGLVQVQRVKQILEEEKGRDRKVSVDTLSSLESDICMLDLEDGFPPSEDTPDDSRSDSPTRPPSSDPLISDVASIRKLLIQLQGLLSQSDASKTEKIEEENSDLKIELSLLRLQLAERDRKIETLERKLEYSQSRSLNRINNNIATQTRKASQINPKPRPLSWDLTSISLVRNINNF